MLKIEDVLDYLGIDYPDDNTSRILERLVAVSISYMKSAVGEKCNFDDEKCKQVQLLVIADLYDNREYESSKMTNSVKRIVVAFMAQLRLECPE